MNELDHLVFRRIGVYADWICAGLRGDDLLAQQFTEHDNPAVRFAEMLAAAVGDRALSFPGHVVLAGEMIQMKLAVFIFGRDKFDWRIVGLFGDATVLTRTETELKNLRARVVDRRANMQGVAGAHRNEKNVRKNQRVRRFRGNAVAGENPLFL